ncbi:polysaccharide pyruvyl transferase family protein [Parvibaculum sp.]|uniref:polysaccharide pyruvyl transferase family protein n=1 Tax=Parvibaculum sp. TaxID=2024848 RepID=UPI001B1F1B6F|nr:polysaccharide pyruvyl transferase family protein [Parvibaculum sp.]MBO6634881.1 polysaccharide pyruvyl transferase family protein [Parvibaculum sp.]MBO6679284.1 polysaccharide pyruvyl transferase family protein [Parvibaculum sp.]MBO6685399.1 polysaccharide pyruvyl transferase family protein [Parvibaculum sp.]
MISKPLRIGLLWHTLRSGNLGCGALTIANMSLIEEAARAAGREVEFHLFEFASDADYRSSVSYPVVEHRFSVKKSLMPGSPLARAMAECDLAVDIGSGDSFADIYGWRRFLHLAWSKYLALRASVPLLLSPQTIGPFDGPGYRFAAAMLMRRALRVYTRDRQSTACMTELGLEDRTRESIDVAFRLPFEWREKFNVDGKVHYGINISALLYRPEHGSRARFSLTCENAELVDALIETLLARPEARVHLVAHVLSNDVRHDDYVLCRELHERYPQTVLMPCFSSPSEAKSEISRLDFLAGSRMHATIAAFSSGVPVVPLGYSRKFVGLYETLGYPLVGDCSRQTKDELVALVLSAVEQKESLLAALEKGNALALSRLDAYRADLTEIIAGLPR